MKCSLDISNFLEEIFPILLFSSFLCIDHLGTEQFSKLVIKILQARLQQYMNQELPDVQAGF